MVSALARRIEALKRNVFHVNLDGTTDVVDCPKATPLRDGAYWKWVFSGISKFIRHSRPPATCHSFLGRQCSIIPFAALATPASVPTVTSWRGFISR